MVALSIAVTIDVGISEEFNLPLYVSFTLLVPALIILLFEKIKIKEVINEFKIGNKKAIIFSTFKKERIKILGG